MSKEFKEYDKKFSRLTATALSTIEKTEGVVDSERIARCNRWPHEVRDWDQDTVQYAVYQAPRAEEWQMFRVSLKGLDTKTKLFCLDWYLEHSTYEFTPVRVDNYIGALVRGGQLNCRLEVVR